MRIISKTHDFYDSVLSHGADRSLVFVRETVEAEGADDFGLDIRLAPSESRVYDEGRGRFAIDDGFYPNVLLFCGKAYPFFEHDERSYGSWPALGLQINHHWTAQDMHADVQRRFPSGVLVRYDTLKSHGNRWGHDRLARSTVDAFYATAFDERKILDLHHRHGSPIIHYGISRQTRKPFTVVNPVLKELGFMRVMDPFKTFQEISMFLGGVMRGNETPMVAIADDVRIAKHGFDRWSFRKKVR